MMRFPCSVGVWSIGLLALSGCDPYGLNHDGRGDPYDGFFDPSVLTGGFAAQTSRTICPKGKCYPAQMGFLKGKPFAFYNLFQYKSSDLAAPMDTMHPLPTATLATNDAYDFGSLCAPAADKSNPLVDAYRKDVQYPIFSKLPVGSGTQYPIVGRHAVSGLSGNVCNDIKTVDTLKMGVFGGMTTGMPDDYQMWTIVDPTAIFTPLGMAAVGLSYGWYNDLQVSFLNSGKIPNDGNGNLIAMTGVIVNPPTGFSKPTDPNAVILPKAPGEDGYSPIVALKDFSLGDRENFGDYTGICNGTGCGPQDVDISKLTRSAFNTIFIYAPTP